MTKLKCINEKKKNEKKEHTELTTITKWATKKNVKATNKTNEISKQKKFMGEHLKIQQSVRIVPTMAACEPRHLDNINIIYIIKITHYKIDKTIFTVYGLTTISTGYASMYWWWTYEREHHKTIDKYQKKNTNNIQIAWQKKNLLIWTNFILDGSCAFLLSSSLFLYLWLIFTSDYYPNEETIFDAYRICFNV